MLKVDSVDSGNLAGHLIALGNACHEIAASPIGNQNWISGLDDTIALVRDAARPQTEERRAPSAVHARLDEAIDVFAAALQNAPSTPAGIARRLSDMTQLADAIVTCARAWSLECGDAAEAEITVWAEALLTSVLAHRQDIDLLMPWASLLTPELLAGDETAALLDTIPTLAALPSTAKRYRACSRTACRAGRKPTSRP